ncbi:hypothetical protein [Pedobacter frigiditerrae]|uniref:hypothetical protein n=1 Tax=Pedobacter frigiditerrae TaxID=2530452 RepID=UPI00292CC7A9|nr:hypothetical protein [Pedobacter frigiditerrae]
MIQNIVAKAIVITISNRQLKQTAMNNVQCRYNVAKAFEVFIRKPSAKADGNE